MTLIRETAEICDFGQGMLRVQEEGHRFFNLLLSDIITQSGGKIFWNRPREVNRVYS